MRRHKFDGRDVVEVDVAVMAVNAFQVVEEVLEKASDQSEFVLWVEETETEVRLPRIGLERFLDVLDQLANGWDVSVLPRAAEISPQEAADLLGVSRPYVVKLLRANEIPSHKVGNRWRIRVGDVMAYKRDRDDSRRELLDDLDVLEELDARGLA